MLNYSVWRDSGKIRNGLLAVLVVSKLGMRLVDNWARPDSGKIRNGLLSVLVVAKLGMGLVDQ